MRNLSHHHNVSLPLPFFSLMFLKRRRQICEVEVEVEVPEVFELSKERGKNYRSFSLGIGTIGKDRVVFEPTKDFLRDESLTGTDVTSLQGELDAPLLGDEEEDFSTYLKVKNSLRSMATSLDLFHSNRSSFMRISDLDLSGSPTNLFSSEKKRFPHFHHPSQDAPPGVDHDPKESWIALDNGDGHLAPIAPFAVIALERSGLECAMDKNMWTGDKKTAKTFTNYDWNILDEPVKDLSNHGDNDVFIWTGAFGHGFYGSDIPSVRTEGLVPMSPESLLDLLTDSSRTQEYNKTSLGREDLLVLQDDMENEGPFGKSLTKVVKSTSKPPLVRKTIQLVSLLHAKKLPHGYLIVSRAVSRAEENVHDSKVLRSEVLMGVNVIRRIENEPNKCVMINVNHIRSPVPQMIMKRLSVTAAHSFFSDLRALC